jgi:hypothetical protein
MWRSVENLCAFCIVWTCVMQLCGYKPHSLDEANLGSKLFTMAQQSGATGLVMCAGVLLCDPVHPAPPPFNAAPTFLVSFCPPPPPHPRPPATPPLPPPFFHRFCEGAWLQCASGCRQLAGGAHQPGTGEAAQRARRCVGKQQHPQCVTEQGFLQFCKGRPMCGYRSRGGGAGHAMLRTAACARPAVPRASEPCAM